MPGLNVSERSPGGRSYELIKSKDEAGFAVVSDKEQFAYDVLPITPQLVAAPVAPALPLDADLKLLVPSEVAPEYRVGPSDVLFVTVWEHPELTAAVAGQLHDFVNEGRLVRADGTIFFPYAGSVTVLNKTVDQIARDISVRITSEVNNPQVDVRVVSFRSKRVEVTGEVVKPGMVTLNDTTKGIREAIDEAGGLTPTASRRRVLLERGGKAYPIEVSGRLAGGHSIADVELQPGDSIDVPDQSGDQVFVLGAVDKQQAVVMRQDPMSLMQALTVAGGLDNLRAKDSGVLVFRLTRKSENDRSRVFTLDMSNPTGILMAGEFLLQPRDVVYVKATGFAQYNSVINDVLPSLQTLVDGLSIIYLTR